MKRYIGITDEDLLENTVLEKQYPAVDIVFSSPLKRCTETAALIYPNQKPVICNGFSETDFGKFENKSYEDLKENEEYKKWLASFGKLPFPGGESREHFIERCIREHEKIMLENCGKDIAYIVHGGTIMAIMQHIFGGNFYDYQVENLCGYIVLYNKGNHTVTYNALDYRRI